MKLFYWRRQHGGIFNNLKKHRCIVLVIFIRDEQRILFCRPTRPVPFLIAVKWFSLFSINPVYSKCSWNWFSPCQDIFQRWGMYRRRCVADDIFWDRAGLWGAFVRVWRDPASGRASQGMARAQRLTSVSAFPTKVKRLFKPRFF